MRIAPIPTDSESCGEWGLERGLSESSPGNPEAAGVGDPGSEPTTVPLATSFPAALLPTLEMPIAEGSPHFKGKEKAF